MKISDSASLGTGPASWRAHFPALRQQVGGHPLNYLDTAATSLRPRAVIEALSAFYSGPSANPGAALHTLARQSSRLYDDARLAIASFVGSCDPLEVVFTRGTTEAINLVATAWGSHRLGRGDEILLGTGEHASNMLPWQLLAERIGATVRYAGLTPDGHVDLDGYRNLLSPRTRIVAMSHVSNVLGMVNPVRELCSMARAAGAVTLVDAAQSVPHFQVNVHDLGCDFLAFSGHKMCGPMGAGALWVRRGIIDALPPYQAGSNMAHNVDLDSRHFSDGALKFGAGTPNVADAIGFAAGAQFLEAIGWDALRAHEQEITRHMLDCLTGIRGVRLLGSHDPAEKIGVFAFTLEGHTPPDVAAALDRKGIAVRAGDLAALPLLRHLGTSTAVRASCYLYTSRDDVDRFAAELEQLQNVA